jgi:hypothetical protein
MISMNKQDSSIPPLEKYARNEHGLIKSVEYTYSEDGSIDWRAMIKPEFLYANKGWFESRNKPVPTSIEGLTDKQLLIMLGGIKELAKLRGFHSVIYDVKHVNENYVIAKCKISWIGNYESANNYDYHTVVYEDVANATLANTDDFCAKFLETIACNRAFVRCVRNFLGIHIVGSDEIDRSNNNSFSFESPEDTDDLSVLKPSGLLEKIVSEKGIKSFDDFKTWLRDQWLTNTYRNEEAKNWNNYKDVPAKDCRKLITILKKN